MRLLRQLMALLLTAMLLCSTAFAAEPAAPLTILGPLKNCNSVSTPLPFLKVGDSPALLTDLPDRVPCSLATSDETENVYNCPVVWKLDSLDTSTPGYKSLLGILSPEAGYRMADGASNQITRGVMVTAPSMEAQAITGIAPAESQHYLMAVGDSLDTLSLRSMDAICLTDSFGEYFTCPVRWELGAVDTAVAGSYTVLGSPVLPDGFCMPVGLSSLPDLTQVVGVVETDCVDLSAVWIDPNNSYLLNCQWLYTPMAIETPVLQYATVKDEWHNNANPNNVSNAPDYGYITWGGLGLGINLNTLKLHTDYWFRVLYDGSRYSNSLHIHLEDNDFVYTVGGIGGDRDGGDLDGNRLPATEQSAPDVGDKNEAVPKPITEIVTETSTTLSGTRLAQLTAMGSTVLFEKQGVAVELPSSLLSGLCLGEEQLLEVTLLRPSDDMFSLSILANGKALEALPETTVRLPWKADNQKLECINSNGAHGSDVVYEPAAGTVRCAITATGTYRIAAVSADDTLQKASSVSSQIKVTAPKTAPPPAAKNPDTSMESAPPDIGGSVSLVVLLLAIAWLAVRRSRNE